MAYYKANLASWGKRPGRTSARPELSSAACAQGVKWPMLIFRQASLLAFLALISCSTTRDFSNAPFSEEAYDEIAAFSLAQAQEDGANKYFVTIVDFGMQTTFAGKVVVIGRRTTQ